MELADKLEILADAAKYDVACTSSGVERNARRGQLGTAHSAGCCHSFTPDGRCICLLKVLLSNYCIYDCAYCVNRCSNDHRRATFSPRELADLTIDFYRRNYIEGLFLSSGIVKSPDYTSELMIRTLHILRDEYDFRGYIHAKAIPGSSSEAIDQLGRLADRLSVNMELPSRESLALLAPDKQKQNLIGPMRYIQRTITEDTDKRALSSKQSRALAWRKQAPTLTRPRAFAPAGQSTQMIIGATPESDFHILNLSAALYKTIQMKRVFFSAYLPVNHDTRLPESPRIQLDREHRLYQADWLMRFYHFDVAEIIDEAHPFLDLALDPKANWAINHLDRFPLEVNTAPYCELLRVPGIGVRGAQSIMRARKTHTLTERELRRLGIVYKRARFFITCNNSWGATGIPFDRDSIRAQLVAAINGGKHGRRSGGVIAGQLSFDDLIAPAEIPGQVVDPISSKQTMAPVTRTQHPNQLLGSFETETKCAS